MKSGKRSYEITASWTMIDVILKDGELGDPSPVLILDDVQSM